MPPKPQEEVTRPLAHHSRNTGTAFLGLSGPPRGGGPQAHPALSHSHADAAEHAVLALGTTVLRIRLIGGDRMDITYDEPDVSDEDQLVEHVISTLAEDSGVLRSKHGDRLVVLYGRGIAAIEVAPRGAVL
jgi:hypothetical protein